MIWILQSTYCNLFRIKKQNKAVKLKKNEINTAFNLRLSV